ncbi:hypothetical protein [Rubricoccus marinus]|uniref:Peptidase C-terminal archaeal/bacterial domain-containing protein n=1 Tax=Rubricoccus marinus TaxID=716817 RepID=A0A259TXK6_9BACT|nr:hypothetical protein [Rubricoccus marinus]OZC02430.1 hypothetical protein BSZ36_05225 [Rubricoccus marinus]
MRHPIWTALLAVTLFGCEFAFPPTGWDDAPSPRATASGGTPSADPAVARLDPVELRMGQALRYEIQPPRGERVQSVYPDCDGAVRSETSGARGVVLNPDAPSVSCEIVIELPRGAQFSEAWNAPERVAGGVYEFALPPEADLAWLVRATTQRLRDTGAGLAWELTNDGWWQVRHQGAGYRAAAWTTALRETDDGLELFCTDGNACIATCADAACSAIPASGAEATVSRRFVIADIGVRNATRIRLLEVRRRVIEALVAQGESTDPNDYLVLLTDTFYLYHPDGLRVNAGDGGWVFALGETRYAAPFGALEGGAVDGQPALVCRDGSDCLYLSEDERVGSVLLGLDPMTPHQAYGTILGAFETVERLARKRREAEQTEQDRAMAEVLARAEAQAARADSLLAALAKDAAEASGDVRPPENAAPEAPQWHRVEGTLDGSQGIFQLSPDHTGPAVTYELELTEGDTLYVEMLSSDFDPFLTLANTGGYVLHNDDRGLGLNAGLRYVIPASGAYGILAGSASADARGGFTLRLRTESP